MLGGMLLYKRNVFVKQHDATDCAAACLSMICFYYKKELSITMIRDILGTDIDGTTLLGLESAAKHLGFEAKAIRVTQNGFNSKFTLPAIAHLITDTGLCHFVVIRKIKNGYVWISDPGRGNKKISQDEFFNDFDGVMLLLAPSDEFVMSKDSSQGVFTRFVRILNSQKKLFIYSILASFLLTIMGIISSLFNKYLMDEILPYNLKNDLIIYVVAFALIAITQAVIEFIRSHMLLYLSQKIDIPLVLGYFKHIFSLPMNFFSTRKVGDVLTRFSDSFTIKNVLTSIYLTIIIDVVMAIASGAILFSMNSTLFMVIVVLTIMSALLIFAFKSSYKKINLEKMEQLSELNSSIIESLKGIETIKSNVNENAAMERVEKYYIRSLRTSFREGFLSNVQSMLGTLISSIGNLALMFVGALLVMDGKITLGTLLSFATLSGFFMGPIGRLIGVQMSIQEAGISMKRISELMDIKPESIENDDTAKIDNIDGDIHIKDLTFRYGYRPPVLNKVNINIPRGKKVALVGESGSGKTTISKLLLKFYDIDYGTITIGGNDINNINIGSLRKSIAYVPQNIELFSGSIIDNIKIGKEDATKSDIQRACKIAGCDEFIERLPAKYNSFLEEAGGGLSGGERQRLAMARAIVKDCKFMILDEATSNLDFLSERKIYDAIFNKLSDTTMLIIAHRLSTIKSCDLIYVMDKGCVVEFGTHNELINAEGMYFKLWNSQVGNPTYDIFEQTNKQMNNYDLSHTDIITY